MNNKIYDIQAESLKDFWDSQKKRLELLSGKSITDDVLALTSAFGECEIQAFEKLMQTQRQLAESLMQTSQTPAAAVENMIAVNDVTAAEHEIAAKAVITDKRIPNPVIDSLDLSDPRTVRRFEVHNVENDGGMRGASKIPSSGILLLLGKADAHTSAMAEFFNGKGMTVRWIEKNLSEEEAKDFIEKTAKEGPVAGLLLAANVYDSQDLNQCIFDHTMTAVYLIKHYTIYIRDLKPEWRSFVLFTTFLDGKLGFTGENEHYGYGTFNGVAKTLSIEFGEQADIKLIDFEPDVTPEKMLEIIEDEMCVYDGLPEIGRTSDGRRWSTHGVFTDSVVLENRCPYSSDDVIVVTGGSRGVTSQCILALMQKAPCKLVILGRAVICDENMDDEESARIPDLKEMKTLIARRFKAAGYKGSFANIEAKAKAILAQRDMLHTFRTLEETGCKVHYYSCDVNDRNNLVQTIEKIQREVGPVRGIIHGAGLLADCKIWNKDMQRFRMVLATKYVGLNNLLDCVDIEKLKLVVSFSSVAGYFGNDGQMDYAAGNEFLDKFAHHFRKRYPNCKSLTINWGAWDGGMMDYIYRKTLTDKGYVLIPMEVGANYFANEFLNGLPYGQILISNNDKPVDATRPAE